MQSDRVRLSEKVGTEEGFPALEVFLSNRRETDG